MPEHKKSNIEVMLEDMNIPTMNMTQALFSFVPGEIIRVQVSYILGKDQFDRFIQEMNEYIAIPKKQKKDD